MSFIILSLFFNLPFSSPVIRKYILYIQIQMYLQIVFLIFHYLFYTHRYRHHLHFSFIFYLSNKSSFEILFFQILDIVSRSIIGPLEKFFNIKFSTIIMIIIDINDQVTLTQKRVINEFLTSHGYVNFIIILILKNFYKLLINK